MSFGRRRAAEPVFVNVYDLHASNDYVYSFGLGAYHSGVEVYGVEYSFGSGGGVFSHAPKVGSGANFRESIPLGETHLSEAEIKTIVDSLRDEFHGSSYNVITKNCNTFSNALVQRLLQRDVPGYINRLAYFGSFMSCLLPPSMTGQAPVTEGGSSGGSSSDSGFTSFPATRRASVATEPLPKFAGEGRSLGSTAPAATTPEHIMTSSEDGHGASSSSRRELLARAAAARFASSSS